MPSKSIEKRLATIERELHELKEKVDNGKTPWWRKIANTFVGDPYYEEAMRYGREYRESTKPKPLNKKKRKISDGDS